MSDEQKNSQVPEADQELALAAEDAALADVQDLQAELAECKDRMLRNAAELENYKRRTERDKQEFMKRATEGLLKDLLAVVDNLDRALEASDNQEAEAGSLVEGLELTRQEMMKVLSKNGLSRIEALGQPFDPELHEAVLQQENTQVEENTVLAEMQKGYLHHDRLLRPAMVIVSKRPVTSEKGTKVNIKVH